jgi:hypothetical protein
MAPNSIKVNPQMQKLADNAVTAARDKFGLDLDFSEDSLQQLETILGQVDERYKQAPGDGSSPNIPIENTVRIWGSYLGEVMRRSLGGDWIVDENAVYLQLGNRKLSPLGQVRSRSLEGPLFNVHRFFFRIKSEINTNIKEQVDQSIPDKENPPAARPEKQDLLNKPGWEYMFIQQNNFPLANGVYVVSARGKREKIIKGTVDESKVLELLNYYGRSGWEVVGVGNTGTGTGSMTTWTLKRAKTG